MRRPEEFLSLQQIEVARQRTMWISRVLKTSLQPLSNGAQVLSLGSGQGFELLHLRDFAGAGAQLHAVEQTITIPETYQAAKAHIHQADLRNVQAVLQLIGDIPELIVCRHPEILYLLDKSSQKLQWNEWWLSTLCEYADVLPKSGQMLVTAYALQEAEKLANAFDQAGLKYNQKQTRFSPRQLALRHPHPDGDIIMRPDQFVFKIRGR